MIESQRSLLFTEWSRSHSTSDATPPEVWNAMPDQFSTDPTVRALLRRAKMQRAQRKTEDEAYFDDERLGELVGEMQIGTEVGMNGTNGLHDAS